MSDYTEQIPENLENINLQEMRDEGSIYWHFTSGIDTEGMSLKERGKLRRQSRRGGLDNHPELKYADSTSSIEDYSLKELGRGITEADDDSFYTYDVVDY